MADQPISQSRASGIVTLQPSDARVVVPGGRRQFGRWALASAGLLVLAACGGGSSGSVSGAGSGRVDLYWAFDQLRDGMNKNDLVQLVGELPNSIRTGDEWQWFYPPQQLYVIFDARTNEIIDRATVSTTDGSRPMFARGFNVN